MRHWQTSFQTGKCFYSSLKLLRQHRHPIPAVLTRPDPFLTFSPQLSRLRVHIVSLIGSAHPSLSSIAQFYFQHHSQQLRPLIVFLFAQATNGFGRDWQPKKGIAEREGVERATELNSPLVRPDVLYDWNPNMPDYLSSFNGVFPLNVPLPPRLPSESLPAEARVSIDESMLLPAQVRLAQIVEMIHVASLFHESVLDDSLSTSEDPMYRKFGNKLAVLGGDFLLGRASAALSRLDESEVVELIASVVANIVEGQYLKGTPFNEDLWQVYMRMAYLRQASLMAKAARATVVLGGCRAGDTFREVAYSYGRNIGIAFQVSCLTCCLS